MIRTVLLLASLYGLAQSSGVHDGALPSQLAPVAAIGPGAPIAEVPAPVVTAASSQYFHRTFNRLVGPPVLASVAPVVPPPPQQFIPVAPAPPVFVEPTRTVPVVVNPSPNPADPTQPNVAIAIATAHAAAPVATILLPPYPFGFPPNIGFIPPDQPINVPEENNKEPTTQSTTQAEVTKAEEPEPTTPTPSNSDNNFAQALPSNVDINTFKQYGPPALPSDGQGQQFQPNQPHPQFQPNQPNPQFQPNQPRPEIQPLPLRPQFQPQQPQQPQPEFPPYAPQPQFPPQQPRPQFQPVPQPQQPRPQFAPQHQPRPATPHKAKPQKLKTSVEVVPVPLAYITPPPLPKTHAHIKTVKHIYTYIPVTSSKIVLKPVKVRSVRLVKVIKTVPSLNVRANARDFEVTTINPFLRPNTKPPRV